MGQSKWTKCDSSPSIPQACDKACYNIRVWYIHAPAIRSCDVLVDFMTTLSFFSVRICYISGCLKRCHTHLVSRVSWCWRPKKNGAVMTVPGDAVFMVFILCQTFKGSFKRKWPSRHQNGLTPDICTGSSADFNILSRHLRGIFRRLQ